LYEYRCTKCGNRFDKIQKFNDEPETVCPKCGGELERPLTAPALQFKGAGWYVNDYASKPAASSGAEKPAADKAPAGESKPSGDAAPSSTRESAPKPASTPSTPGSSTTT
jgi:putative FmdB family regulatory protein